MCWARKIQLLHERERRFMAANKTNDEKEVGCCYECDSINSNEQVIRDFVAFKNFQYHIVWEIGNHASNHSVSIPNLMQLKSIYLPFPSLRWENFVWFGLVAAAWRETVLTWTPFFSISFVFSPFISNYNHFWDHQICHYWFLSNSFFYHLLMMIRNGISSELN